MAGTQYGNFSPKEDDPFPIEQVLAPLATGGSSALAAKMLDMYQLQRQTSLDNYNVGLQAQHEFAKQQLAQQLMEAKLKALPDLLKAPGGAELLPSSGVTEGYDPAAVTAAQIAARQAGAATNLEHAGAGVNSMSQAGYGIPIPAVSGITGIPGITPQTPRDIEIARINAAGRVAAAGVSAANAGAPTIHLTGQPNPDYGGLAPGLSWSGKAHMTPEQALEYARQHGLTPQGITGLPPAKTEGGEAAKPAPSSTTQRPAAASAPGDKQVFDQVRNYVANNGPAIDKQFGQGAAADIQAGYAKNGGNPVIKQGPDGKPRLVGASGKTYP